MFNARRIPTLFLILSMAAVVPITAQRQEPTRAQETSPTRITQQQHERLRARIETAMSIINQMESAAQGANLAPGWRQAKLESLLGLSLPQLQAVQRSAFSLEGIAHATSAALEDPTLLGDPGEDLVYRPNPPCRFIDTRITPGTRLDGTVAFDLNNNGSAYGGQAACDPKTIWGLVSEKEAAAVAMNVTIVDPTVPSGFVAARPNAAAPLTSLVNWYQAGPTVQAANQGIVTTDLNIASASEFVIHSSSPVHVIVDLFGAFTAPEATALQIVDVTTLYTVNAPGDTFNVLATCPAGYSVTGGGASLNVGVFNGVFFTELLRSGNSYNCKGIHTGGGAGTQTGLCQAICARVPGR